MRCGQLEGGDDVGAGDLQVMGNVPPTVSMLATPTNATAPAEMLLNAAASDDDGSVAKVEFFIGSTLLASMPQAPYTYNWMSVAAGTYTITAKATDDRGAVTVSEPVTVKVTALPAAAQVYYIDSDHLNTPRVITDASNNIVWQWDNSDPFGGNVPEEDPGNTGTRMEFNLRFPGQYFDRETGLYYNYHRTYDPNTGRYVESDPIGLRGGINTYGYVFSNPGSFSDRKGLQLSRTATGAGAGGIPGTLSPAQLEAASALDRLGRAAAEAASKLLTTTLCFAFPAHCAAAAAATAENAGNTRGLPPEGVNPPIPDADQCKPGPASRPSEVDKGGESLWDPRGGEWRWFQGNRWHNPHWDYNSHTPGSRWENIPHGDLPPVKPTPDPK